MRRNCELAAALAPVTQSVGAAIPAIGLVRLAEDNNTWADGRIDLEP
jgi:hypothetical protein